MNNLPVDDALRIELHNEVHTRPSARIHLPAFIVLVGVFNSGVSREQEWEHLKRLQPDLLFEEIQGNFLRLSLGASTLRWERHTEFTRYSLLQALPQGVDLESQDTQLLNHLTLPDGWLAAIPGRTFAAIELIMLHNDLSESQQSLRKAQQWFGEDTVVASRMGNPAHSLVVTDFHLRPSGFERILVLAPASTNDTRGGRISQRLLELETYRLMALRGLPVAKAVGAQLSWAERELADITAALQNKAAQDQTMLDRLIGLAASVELITAEHAFRFAATAAYDKLVRERIAELRESPISGTQTIGEFMQRRLSPAMATVAATGLRTRVDIATEEQNSQLLAKLTKGQELQLRLQTTVEGMSIAAISYYVISLVLYLGKAAKAAGLPIHPEITAGACIPLVLWLVWRTIKRIHDKLRSEG